MAEKAAAAEPGQMAIAQELVEQAAKPKKTFDLPTFIPGIIIQGHMWHLIITTPQDRKTMVWQSVSIGTTQSTKGIYQIVYILHLLREWVKSTYWPLIWNIVSAGWPEMPA
jgi:CHASE2 domain-containing sensor protein